MKNLLSKNKCGTVFLNVPVIIHQRPFFRRIGAFHQNALCRPVSATAISLTQYHVLYPPVPASQTRDICIHIKGRLRGTTGMTFISLSGLWEPRFSEARCAEMTATACTQPIRSSCPIWLRCAHTKALHTSRALSLRRFTKNGGGVNDNGTRGSPRGFHGRPNKAGSYAGNVADFTFRTIQCQRKVTVSAFRNKAKINTSWEGIIPIINRTENTRSHCPAAYKKKQGVFRITRMLFRHAS